MQRSDDFYSRVLGLEISSRTANGGLNMGLESESFLVLYKLGNPGCVHHLCVGVDNYNPDLLAKRRRIMGSRPISMGIRSIGPVAGISCILMAWKAFLYSLSSTSPLANYTCLGAPDNFFRFAKVLSVLS